MERISINTQPAYEVVIGRGLLNRAGELTAETGIHAGAAMVFADDHVAPIYLDRVRESFDKAGFRTAAHIFPAGETNKTLGTVEEMLLAADRENMTRSDLFVALGGGVTGDMTGLAAGLYLRGCSCIQIPTTLLAMVDASVGGKTAVNLRSGKNLCGLFYQPGLVICDPDTLQTLPPPVLAEGMAEVVKHGAICDAELLDGLRQEMDEAEMIARNVRIKSEVVAQDERETGRRQILNLGHTFGHAVEKLSGFRIYHGEGVSIGLCIAACAAEAHGLCEKGVLAELRDLLGRFRLPVTTRLRASEIAAAALNDKKRRGDSITLVLPVKRGRSVLYPLPVSELAGFIACCDGRVTAL